MGVSFRKPEDTYRAQPNDMAGTIADLNARLDNLEKSIGTRIDRGVISNAEEFRKLEETLEELRKKSLMRSTNNNRSFLAFQLELQNFEADVLSFLEELTIDQNSDKRLKEWRKLKTEQRITGKEGRLPSFKF